MKQEIFNILKKFEQRDHKSGGVSITPESYDAICNAIYSKVVLKIESRANCPVNQNCQCGLGGKWDGYCAINKKAYTLKKQRKPMSPEQKLKLSIEALDNFGVYPEIIKDMLSDLKQLVVEKKSEKIAKEHKTKANW
jgi:hypothetical protein